MKKSYHIAMGSCCWNFVVNSSLFVLSCTFQILGFATPGWLVLIFGRNNDYYVGLGLWNVYSCKHFIGECIYKGVISSKGVIKSFQPGYNQAEKGFLEYQIETTLAILCLLVGVFLYVVGCCHRNPGKTVSFKRYAVAAVVSSGLFAFIAVSRMADVIMKGREDYTDAYSKAEIHVYEDSSTPFDFPYSLLLLGIGGLFSFGTGLSIGCDVCIASRRMSVVQEDDPLGFGMEPVHGMWPNDRERLSTA